MIEEDFLSDDDSVDFDTMMELPPNGQTDRTEENLSRPHEGMVLTLSYLRYFGVFLSLSLITNNWKHYILEKLENEYISYHSPEYQPNSFHLSNLLELSIETLLGTSYEVRLSPRTTIAFLKAKLQRSEGIPKHHLHLVYRGKPSSF